MKKKLIVSLAVFALILTSSCTSTSKREQYKGQKQVVAVPAFIDLSKSDVSAKVIDGITDKFSTELVKTGRFAVVERSRLKEILKEHELAMSGALAESDAVKLGRLVQAPYIILGTVNALSVTKSSMIDDTIFGYSQATIKITLTLKVISTTTGAAVAAAEVTNEAVKPIMRMGMDTETQFFKIGDDMAKSDSPIQEEIYKSVTKLVDDIYEQNF